MKWVVILILCLTFVSAVDINKIICDDSYYFLLNLVEIDKNITYSNFQLQNLTRQISLDAQTEIDPNTVEYFLKNFENVCKKPLILTFSEEKQGNGKYWLTFSIIALVGLFVIYVFSRLKKEKTKDLYSSEQYINYK